MVVQRMVQSSHVYQSHRESLYPLIRALAASCKAGEAVRNDKKEMRLEQSISWSQVLPTVVTLGPASPLHPERLTLKMPSFHSKVYSPRIRADSLVLQPISQSQAEMRKQVLGSSSSGSSTDREPSAGVLAAGDTGALTPLSLVSSREAFLSVL